MAQTIVFKNGETLSIGETFYYVDPCLHGGEITECLVDSFFHGDPKFGELIRFTVKGKSFWMFAHKQFFERENPTCFLRYADAEACANELRYIIR